MTASKIEDDQQEEEEWEELPPIPPDGGWGWVVVMAALFCNIIVDGVCFSFGIFLLELQRFYGEGKGKTAWVGSLIPGMYLGTGPIVSALSNKFGCRTVTIVGAFSSAFFFFLSTFSPNVDVLIFLYGVMGEFHYRRTTARSLVSTDIDGKNTWKECFSAQGVRLPVGYFFGATAATGDLADNHDIISMKLYDVASEDSSGSLSDEELRKVIPSADIFAPPRDHVEDPKGAFMLGSMSGWKLLVVIILIIIGLTVCGVVGFVVFAKRQEQSRKRFY